MTGRVARIPTVFVGAREPGLIGEKLEALELLRCLTASGDLGAREASVIVRSRRAWQLACSSESSRDTVANATNSAFSV